MLTYALLTGGVFLLLCGVFVVTDWVLAKRELVEKERWNKAFGGSTAARSGGRRSG